MDEASKVFFLSWQKHKDAFPHHITATHHHQVTPALMAPSLSKNPVAEDLKKLKDGVRYDPQDWVIRQIHCIANAGRFSSDRTIAEYCDEIWRVQDLSIPKGAATPIERIKSFPYVS